MTKQFIIRASALPNFTDCQRRGAAALRGITNPRADGYTLAATLHGSVVHDAVAKILTGGYVLDSNSALDRQITDDYNAAIKDAGRVVFDSTTPSRADGAWQAATAALAIADKLLEDFGCLDGIEASGELRDKFQAVEKQITTPLINGGKMTGHLDVLTTDGRLIDYKTGMRLQCYPPQLGAYAFMARRAGLVVNTLEHWHLPRSKKQGIAPTIYRYDVEESIAIAEAVVLAAQTTHNQPLQSILPNPQSILCSAKFCPLHSTKECIHGQQKENTKEKHQ